MLDTTIIAALTDAEKQQIKSWFYAGKLTELETFYVEKNILSCESCATLETVQAWTNYIIATHLI